MHVLTPTLSLPLGRVLNFLKLYNSGNSWNLLQAPCIPELDAVKVGLFVESLTGHCRQILPVRKLRSNLKLNDLLRTRTLVFWVQINCFFTWSHCLSKDQGRVLAEISHTTAWPKTKLTSTQECLRTLFGPGYRGWSRVSYIIIKFPIPGVWPHAWSYRTSFYFWILPSAL